MPLPESPFSEFNVPIYFRPVIPLLFSFITGIIIALYFPGPPVPIVLIAIPASGIIIYGFVSGKNTKNSPLILYACLGYLSYTSCIALSSNTGHVAHYADGRVWKISGAIASEPIIQTYKQKYILSDIELSPVSGNDPPLPVHGNIQVNIYGKCEEFCPGDRIMLAGEIRPFRSFQNPGGFDYTRYMMWQNLWGNVSISADKLNALGSGDLNFRTVINTIREKILLLINQASQGDAKAVLSALIVGDRREITTALQQAFNRTGVSHVLSISGLHVGIVATAAFVFFRWILSFFKPLLLRAWTKKGAAVLAIFPVVFYGLIAGMPPATERSVIMVAVFLLTFLIEREHDLFNTIAIAALAILIFNPPALFSISFQLSFVAVLSIFWGMSLFRNQIYQSALGKNFIIKSVAMIFFVTLFATIGTSPLVMHYFNLFPIAGIVANLVVVPLMGSVVVIVGLFSVLVLYPVSTQAAVWGLQLCDVILKPTIAFVTYLSQMEFCALKTITPSILELICFYLLVSGVILFTRQKSSPADGKGNSRNYAMPQPVNHLFNRWLYIMILTVVVVLVADILYWANHRLWHDDFRVTVMDVGQGNAALLEFPQGYCALIDGGGFSDNSMFDVGERVLAPYLWRNKIKTVDTVILTHPDSDHLNGLIYILKNFNIKQVISTHQASDSEPYREFTDLIQNNNISHPDFKTIEKTIPINGATLQLLYPPEDFMERRIVKPSKDPNDNSIVIKAGFGDFSILFPGDIMQTAENEIVSSNPGSLPSTILIAPHHGSKTSSTPAFLDAVDPELIIISSGKPDRFPAQEVLERYENRGCHILRMDHNGAVRIVSDGKVMSILPMLGEKMIIQN